MPSPSFCDSGGCVTALLRLSVSLALLWQGPALQRHHWQSACCPVLSQQPAKTVRYYGVMPASGTDLVLWGSKLHSCMSCGYLNSCALLILLHVGISLCCCFTCIVAMPQLFHCCPVYQATEAQCPYWRDSAGVFQQHKARDSVRNFTLFYVVHLCMPRSGYACSKICGAD